jgi:ferredoxin
MSAMEKVTKKEFVDLVSERVMGDTKFVKVKLYGEIHNVEVEEDENILQAMFRANLDPPFSCQVGTCGTCMAKLESGNVTMDEPDALTEEDIKNGFILTCQARPKSDDCFVNYDY